MLSVQRLRDTTTARVATALLPGAIGRGPTHDADGRPLLYLTVDDGPDLEGTPLWLGTLARHDAHATFFLSAGPARARSELVNAILEDGHRIGNHGGPHRSAWRMTPGPVLEAFEDAEATLDQIAGAPVRDVRPPYGRVTPGLIRWSRQSGRRLVLWDVMPGDFLDRSPETLAREILETSRPGSIVVLHDGP
ncbi:polysaccharide deacetylase family protein, partial [Rubrivirga sp.]|uniref:polysaccharide deacetylase family protein n=1 Tax=Rubrivirga sp. TaxID=1885344 RepID=UPI003C7309F9